jgi:hypothetical protein
MRVQALLTPMESQQNIPLRAGANPRRAPADTRVTPARQVDDFVLTRRSFLAAGVVALGLPASAGGAAPVAHRHRVRLRLTLLAPTGPHAIGTVQLHLVDHSRRDPWVPSRRRELMISIWYPAVSTGSYPSAPWIPQPAGNLFLSQLVGSLPSSGGRLAPPGGKPPTIPLPGVQLPVTHARDGAPVLSSGAYPVVLYQPGQGDVRALGTGLVSDLASRGYVRANSHGRASPKSSAPSSRPAPSLPNAPTSPHSSICNCAVSPARTRCSADPLPNTRRSSSSAADNVARQPTSAPRASGGGGDMLMGIRRSVSGMAYWGASRAVRRAGFPAPRKSVPRIRALLGRISQASNRALVDHVIGIAKSQSGP